MKKTVAVLICLVMTLLIVGCSNDSGGLSPGDDTAKETQTDVKEEVIVISAPELSKEYEADEASADLKYRGKLVEVDGEVLARGEVAGKTFVTLVAIEGSAETGVQCFFEDKAEVKKAEALIQGDSARISGVVDEKGLNVRLVNCSFK